MNPEPGFRLAAAPILVVAIAIAGYYRARADRSGGALPAEPRRRKVSLQLAIGLVMWGTLLFEIVAPSLVPWSRLLLPNTLRWLGVGVGLAMILLLWWTMRSIGSNVSRSTSTRAGASLVTHGPYRWIRHPIYTTGVGLYLAFALMLDSKPIFAFVVILVIWLPFRVRDEERSLLASYGEAYRAYIGRTGRFLPRP